MDNFYKALTENRERIQKLRSKELEKQRVKAKREKIESRILTILIMFFVVMATVLLIISYNKDMKSCQSAGNTKQYCERGLK